MLLGSLAGTRRSDLVGNLHGRVGLDVARGGNPLEIDMALGLFEPMRVAHLTNPHLRWSYYFSGRGDFLVVYPFASGADFMRALHTPTFDEYLGAMYAYDVYRMATPARNPKRHSYWTPTYLDAGGAGWMVSHAAPVYVGRWFRGHGRAPTSCSTSSMRRSAGSIDRRAGYGSSTIAAVSWPTVRVGAPRHGGVEHRRMRCRRRLRRIAAGATARAIDETAQGWRVGADGVAARRAMAPGVRCRRGRDNRPRSRAAVALWAAARWRAATLVLAQHLLQRYFVGPAIALAGRVREQGDGGSTPSLPRVPDVWRPWFAAVDDAFRSGRRHLAHARDEEARKSAVLEAAFDSIITTDESGRVLELNEGAEGTFGFAVATRSASRSAS